MKKREIIELLKKKRNLLLSEKEGNLACTHPVLLKDSYMFGTTHKCVFCKKNIDRDYISDSKDVVILDKDPIDKNGGFDYEGYGDYYYFGDYKREEIISFIKEILKPKNNDDDITFSDEFLKLFQSLEIGNVEINGTKYRKEYNILLIDGSNEIKINDDISLKNTKTSKANSLIEYLTYICRIHLTLISSTNSKKLNSKKYKSIQELKMYLKDLRGNNFDLIIDLSNLLEYKIDKNNKISINSFSLNLEEMFPNSKIIRINNSSYKKVFKEELSKDNKISNDFKRLILKRPKV